jgi:hypothetical protein
MQSAVSERVPLVSGETLGPPDLCRQVSPNIGCSLTWSTERPARAMRFAEIYSLVAQIHVVVSFESPEYTANGDALEVLRLREAIRIPGMERKTRFYQASTSELYGLVQEIPQKETTPFYRPSRHGRQRDCASAGAGGRQARHRG